jgi:hypothetical protein
MNKIALCFLSYGDVQQKDIWSAFLEAADPSKYSVFLHRADGVQTSWIPRCTSIPTQPTKWGSFSLVKAQQALFNEAFKDPDIYKFILLSGDTIPLYTFEKLYTQLTQHDKGCMSMCADPQYSRERSVNRRAWSSNYPWAWKKADQWVVLNRSHVQLLQQNWTMIQAVFAKSEVPDEHVYPVFFNGVGALHTFNARSVIHVNFYMRTSPCSIKHHSTPATYHTNAFTPAYVDKIYTSGCMFIRKICPTASITMDWDAEKPLVPILQPIVEPRKKSLLPLVRTILSRV